MTSEHVRRAIVLLFLFNLALLAQNWRTSYRIDQMNTTATSSLKAAGESKVAVDEIKVMYQKGNDRVDQVLDRLDHLIEQEPASKKGNK